MKAYVAFGKVRQRESQADGVTEMLSREGFVQVKEAATILDVAPNTIRAWGAAGSITEYRHPVNNYRLYKRVELEKLLSRLQEPAKTVRKKKPR